MTLQDTPCPNCRMPVIHAVQLNGLPVFCDLDPVLTGTWKLVERDGRPPLATKPAGKYSFGVKLYPAHVCVRKWRK